MRHRNLVASIIACSMGLTGLIPLSASASESPPQKSTSLDQTSKSMAPDIQSIAKSGGFESELVIWAVKDGKLEIGLSTVQGTEGALLEAKLGMDVVVTQETPYEPSVMVTRVNSPVENVKVSGKKVDTLQPGTSSLAQSQSPPLIDHPPFYGGTRIFRSIDNGNGTQDIYQCTSGGVYNNAGQLSMSTAGHCGPKFQVWTQGYFDVAAGKTFGSEYMGSATTVSYGGGVPDMAMISWATYSPRIWVSPTSSMPVSGQAAVGMGTSVCTVGSFTGFVCGAKVDLVNACVVYNAGLPSSQLVCGLDRAVAPYVVNQKGDSGGPVVVNNGSSLKLAGIVSGGIGSPSNTVLFTHINRIVSDLGVSVAQ